MADRCFQLKASNLAVVFQLSIFFILMLLLYQVLVLWIWGICLITGILIYIYAFKRTSGVILEHLDGHTWTLLNHPRAHAHVEISHLIDHQLYIVVYFKHAHAKPLLIWRDQLPTLQWKNLKKLVNLQ